MQIVELYLPSDPTIEVTEPVEPEVIEVTKPAEPEVVEVPTGLRGPSGKSAYKVAVEEGFVGSEQDWLDSLIGAPGNDGSDGLSAYQVAVSEGFVGTVEQWLESLRGADGRDGVDGAPGVDGQDGRDGQDGLSAYEVAVGGGFEGTEAEWLASLKGEPGQDGLPGRDGEQGVPGERGEQGVPGEDGLSAYQVAVSQGFVGTEAQWLESLKGEPGQDGAPGEQGPQGPEGPQGSVGDEGPAGPPGVEGPQGPEGDSAYEVAVSQGFVGSEAAWLESLRGEPGQDGAPGADGLPGEPGDQGPPGVDGQQGPPGEQGEPGQDGAPGVGVPAGGSTGQVLAKASSDDFDTEWVNQSGGGTGDLPPVGSEGDVLTTVSGVWQAAPSQGGSPARQTTVLEGATGDLTVSLAPTAQLVAVESAGAVRVRLYRSVEQRDADRMRHFQSMPEGDAVLADFNFEQASTVWCNPVPILTSVDGEYFILINGGVSDVTLTWERN